MSSPFGNPRTLPDHLTPDGDKVVVELRIQVMASGALAVHGPLEDKVWCLAALEQAKDAVKNHRGGGLIVPGSDTERIAL